MKSLWFFIVFFLDCCKMKVYKQEIANTFPHLGIQYKET